MYPLLVTVAVFVAVLLVMAFYSIEQSGGLAGSFGGTGQFGTVFGTRRTADFLSKATWWLAGALLVLNDSY
jgi:preprotein translocase subunit SecG